MASIRDFYKYAQLATAAYVRIGGSINSGDMVQNASTAEANRLPLPLANYLFDPQPNLPNPAP